jgi:uncharacterized protein YjbJ (UPF0337 family)
MNWDQIEGKWQRFSSSARERWGKLTKDNWETAAGKKDHLVQADGRALAQKAERESHAATRL